MPPTPRNLEPNEIATAIRSAPHLYAQWCSEGQWKAYRWLEWVSRRIARAVRRGGARIILNAPARHGKSEFISFWLPLWHLDVFPASRVMLASYSGELASDFGRKIRNEALVNPLVEITLSEDSQSVERWNTPEGGGMYAVGAGGPLTGRGFNLGIIDDPIKNWEEASSPAARQRLGEWFQSTFRTRAEPGASIIVAMTRWHPGDLAGWLIEEQGDEWDVIALPALAMDDDPMGRQPGEPLCPERYDAQALAGTRSGVGGYVWSALYQQHPINYASGRVYTAFTEANIDAGLTIRPGLDLHLSMDFNLNPGMHALLGQYDREADLFTAVHEIHAPRMDVRGCMTALEQLFARLGGWKAMGCGVLHIYGDRSGKTPDVNTSATSYRLVQKALEKMGVPHRLHVPDANPPIISRVTAFNEALCDIDGERHYAVHPRCTRLLEDFRTLKQGEDTIISKADKKLSHATDAEGYRVVRIRPIRRPKDEPQRVVMG